MPPKFLVPLCAEDSHRCASSPGLPPHHQPSLRPLMLHPDKTQLLIFPINPSKTAVKVNPSLSKLFPHRTLKWLPLLWESKAEPMQWPSARCAVGLLLPALSPLCPLNVFLMTHPVFPDLLVSLHPLESKFCESYLVHHCILSA